MLWDVKFTKKAAKQAGNLPLEVQEKVFVLVVEIRKLGPYRTAWPNDGKLKGKKNCYHCHLKKGKPTYITVWKVADKKNKLIEVRYVGTHENADYERVC
jgi:mRNA-degrading endonuclease RelE of RelBE toxin-antitoxin system